jgi:hypothetical protein
MTLLGRAPFKSKCPFNKQARSRFSRNETILKIQLGGYFLRSGLYINGEWVNPATSRYMPVVNPANKQVFHTVAAAGMDGTK